MSDRAEEHPDGREVLLAAAADVDRARRQLDLHGDAGLATARACLRVAVARLRPVAARVDVRREVRRSAQQCRSTLSSHLLAAENLEAAGVAPAAVANLLRRATEAFEIEPIEHATA
jgi:hypothetical protein